MSQSQSNERSAAATAVKAALAFTGVVAVVFPITALADSVLGSPLGATVLLVTVLAGVLGAIPFVALDWSLRRLVVFIGVGLGSSLIWLVLVGGVLSLLDVSIPGGARGPFLFAGLLALATAYVVVYSGGVDPSADSKNPASLEKGS